MALSQPTKLEVSSRAISGSRAVRRLRRAGRVPGVLYGGDGDPIAFEVEARSLRHALAGTGAVLDLSIDGAAATPAVLKDAQRDPVRGETLHVDLVRVRLDRADPRDGRRSSSRAPTTPPASGTGGVLEQIAHELNVEALPDLDPRVDHPRRLGHGDQRHAARSSRSSRPQGVKLLDDAETVIATLSPPRLQLEAERRSRGDRARRRGRDGEPRATSSRVAPRRGTADGLDPPSRVDR